MERNMTALSVPVNVLRLGELQPGPHAGIKENSALANFYQTFLHATRH